MNKKNKETKGTWYLCLHCGKAFYSTDTSIHIFAGNGMPNKCNTVDCDVNVLDFMPWNTFAEQAGITEEPIEGKVYY